MSLDVVREMFRTLNGPHTMTPDDDEYVRRYFTEVPDTADYPRGEVLDLMARRRLPLPGYLLSDGTAMVHPDYLEPVREAGSVDALHDWFVDHWPAAEHAVAEQEWSEGYLSGQYVCLWSVTPATIQAKTRAIEAIKEETAALDAGRGSVERLARAVDELDALEPPFTAYDRLRFGARTSREVWIDDIRETYLAAV